MSRGRRASRSNKSTFGGLVSDALASSGSSQTALADSLHVSVQYLHNTMTGAKHVSPRWADLVAHALRMSEEQRKQLHVAAAKDAGYDLDLTPADRNR